MATRVRPPGAGATARASDETSARRHVRQLLMYISNLYDNMSWRNKRRPRRRRASGQCNLHRGGGRWFDGRSALCKAVSRQLLKGEAPARSNLRKDWEPITAGDVRMAGRNTARARPGMGSEAREEAGQPPSGTGAGDQLGQGSRDRGDHRHGHCGSRGGDLRLCRHRERRGNPGRRGLRCCGFCDGDGDDRVDRQSPQRTGHHRMSIRRFPEATRLADAGTAAG
jgi:hypothetical protein